MSTESTHLHVQVLENGTEKVAIELPVNAVLRLPELMPPAAIASLEALEVDLEELSARAEASGFRPQILLDIGAGEKRYRLWIR